MSLFSEPKNYSEMLTRIMIFTFFISLVLVGVVAHDLPSVWRFLHPNWLTFSIEALGLKDVPPAYVIVAFLISFVARITKLHDRVSDVFGIRERFDLHEILTPLAGGVGIPIDLERMEKFTERRRQIMGDVFYKYASSTNSVIDQHLIWTALEKWSWFWVCIEGTVIAVLAFLILLATGTFRDAAFLGAVNLIATLAATQTNRACASITHTEVREILKDVQRRKDIEATLRAV